MIAHRLILAAAACLLLLGGWSQGGAFEPGETLDVVLTWEEDITSSRTGSTSRSRRAAV